MRTVAELTLGREPDAVPRARRLVRSALGSVLPDLAPDAELVVSELVTNATLHGEPPITVRLLLNEVVRVEVQDAGRSAPIQLQQGPDAMTGRGLSMVAAVVSAWGVEPLEGEGKVVWAELDPSGPVSSPPAVDLDALLEAWAADDPATATYTVKLGAVSTELLLAAKSHVDNVVRELTLMREGEASSGVMLPPELSALIQTVTVDFAEARTEIKRQAAAAAARGDVLTELELHLTPSAADAGERYLEALDVVDRYGRSAHLLTLAPPRIHRVFRRWYVRSLVAQLRALSAGSEPPPVVPFQVDLAREVAELERAAASASHLTVLQRVSSELARAVYPEQMARTLVDHAVGLPGVETARVRLLSPDRLLRTVAWRGVPGRVDHGEFDISLDSDLPGAVAARTREPRHIRSLAETFSGIPGLAGHYEPGLSGHTMPLVAGDRVLGLLSLTFAGGELSDEAELAFVASLADVLASAIERAGADEQRETALADLRFVLEATTRVNASLDSDDTLRTLARIAVPALADVCLIDLFDGLSFRRVATEAGESVPAEVAERIGREPPDPTGDHPAADALRTGRAVLHESTGPEPGAHSWVAIPLAARGRSLGAMTLGLVEPGRRFTAPRIGMVEDLGRRVALAIDNTQLYESTRQAQRRLDLVARAGVTLTSSLDLATVVANLCDLVVGEVADCCEVHVRRAPEQWWRYSSRISGDRLVRADTVPPLVAEAVETRSIVVAGGGAARAFADPGGVDREAVVTVVPLMAHGDAVGVVALASPEAEGPTRVPAETLEVIAGRAALAVDNALLYEQERTAAEILQRSLLPRRLPSSAGLRAAARYLPAGARNEVGGDWYDLIELDPGRVAVVMGDVMGRGIPAASIMGQLRNGLRMLAVQDAEPAEALQLLNRMLGAEEESPLATVGYGIIDIPARKLALANAGHLPPVLIRAGASRFLDQKPGLPLGALPDSTYRTITHDLQPGDALIMYTDGLIEQRDRSLEDGLAALLRVTAAAEVGDPGELCELLIGSLRRDSDEDDTATLVLLID